MPSLGLWGLTPSAEFFAIWRGTSQCHLAKGQSCSLGDGGVNLTSSLSSCNLEFPPSGPNPLRPALILQAVSELSCGGWGQFSPWQFGSHPPIPSSPLPGWVLSCEQQPWVGKRDRGQLFLRNHPQRWGALISKQDYLQTYTHTPRLLR